MLCHSPMARERSHGRGAFVEVDGLLAVGGGIEGDKDVPEDHRALWFGDPQPSASRLEAKAAILSVGYRDGMIRGLEFVSVAQLERSAAWCRQLLERTGAATATLG